MTRQKYIFICFSALLFAVTACSAAQPQAEPAYPSPTQSVVFTVEPTQGQDNNLPLNDADVPRVSVEDAKRALESGEAVIVDVRSAEAYAEVHIAGAVSVPLLEFENNIAGVPLEKDQWIITYCT